MSQVAAPQMPTPPNQMKKKVISIVAAVLVGHVGVLYAISQMKAPELAPIDKQPLKVRFVKLQEAPKPLPPKPKAEPQKEPPKPKEVKIVDKPLPPPPKKVEKIEQVKKAEAPKVVKAPPVEAKPTPSPVVPTVVTETKVKPAPAPVAPPAPVTPPAPAAPPSPKSVSIGGGVSWQRSPKVSLSAGELKSACSLVVDVSANEQGKVVSATARNSSCSPAVTRKVEAAVRRAQLTKYVENGVAYPTRVEQPFDFQVK